MIKAEDLRVDIYRAGEATVRVTHIPTGLSGTGTDRGGNSVAARDTALLELVPLLRKANVEYQPVQTAEPSLSTFDALLRRLNE